MSIYFFIMRKTYQKIGDEKDKKEENDTKSISVCDVEALM